MRQTDKSKRNKPSFSADRPYNDLPLLLPEVEPETSAVLNLYIEACVELVSLKQLGDTLPNQAVLINTLPVLKAQASSGIENIVTTSARLFRFAEVGGRYIDAVTRASEHFMEMLENLCQLFNLTHNVAWKIEL